MTMNDQRPTFALGDVLLSVGLFVQRQRLPQSWKVCGKSFGARLHDVMNKVPVGASVVNVGAFWCVFVIISCQLEAQFCANVWHMYWANICRPLSIMFGCNLKSSKFYSHPIDNFSAASWYYLGWHCTDIDVVHICLLQCFVDAMRACHSKAIRTHDWWMICDGKEILADGNLTRLKRRAKLREFLTSQIFAVFRIFMGLVKIVILISTIIKSFLGLSSIWFQ